MYLCVPIVPTSYGVVFNSQIMPIKDEVVNTFISTMQLLILVEVARVEIMPIHEKNTCMQLTLVYNDDTNMQEVILLIASNEKPFQLANNLCSILLVLQGLQEKGYKGKFVNSNYSISVPHFKIRLFPRDQNDNLVFEFPPPKTNKLIEVGLENFKGMESKRDEGQNMIRVPPQEH